MNRSPICPGEKTAWQATEHGGWEGDTQHRQRGDSDTVTRRATTVKYRSKFLRYIIGLTLVLLSTLTIYVQYYRSASMIPMAETVGSSTAESMDDESTTTESTYGTNAHPDFTDIIKVQDLDAQYVPTTGEDRRPGRLIIVGDVHGMKNELIALLDKVSFSKEKDHLILVGDLITKGYDSLGVIDLAISLNASAVRGNHEDRVLLAHAELKAKHITSSPGPFEDPSVMIDGEDDDMEEVSWNHGNYEDMRLAKKLDGGQLKWLKGLPVILRVGRIEGMGEVVVVHAGLVAGVGLEAQDPFHAMNMRTIDTHFHVPSAAHDGDNWTKLWNRHQKQLPKHERTTVIYGHDSKRGLRIEEYTKGIDTGCRKGHKLTALVIEGGRSDVKQHIVQYKCEKSG